VENQKLYSYTRKKKKTNLNKPAVTIIVEFIPLWYIIQKIVVYGIRLPIFK